jgi:phasin family protein
MVDTVEQGTDPVAGEAAPAVEPSLDAPSMDAPSLDAVMPEVLAPVTATIAAPEDKPLPVKKAGAAKKVKGRSLAKPTATAPAKPVAPKPVAAKVAPKMAVEVVPPAPTVKPAAAKIPKIKTPTIKTTKPAVAPVLLKATTPSKDIRIMATTTTEITDKFQTAIKDASEKAKAAFEKSQASFGEMGEFTKGNVEALVESTKIFAAGFQALSQSYLTESKSAFETLTAEFKEMAAVKSPKELLELQSALMRKQFDAVVAHSSKNSEAVLKLATEAFQPISTRVSLAVEKVKKAA